MKGKRRNCALSLSLSLSFFSLVMHIDQQLVFVFKWLLLLLHVFTLSEMPLTKRKENKWHSSVCMCAHSNYGQQVVSMLFFLLCEPLVFLYPTCVSTRTDNFYTLARLHIKLCVIDDEFEPEFNRHIYICIGNDYSTTMILLSSSKENVLRLCRERERDRRKRFRLLQ